MFKNLLTGVFGGFAIGIVIAFLVGSAGYCGSSLIGGEWEPFSTWRTITGYGLYGFSAAGSIIGGFVSFSWDRP